MNDVHAGATVFHPYIIPAMFCFLIHFAEQCTGEFGGSFYPHRPGESLIVFENTSSGRLDKATLLHLKA